MFVHNEAADDPEAVQVDLDDEADTERLGRVLAGVAPVDTVIALVGDLGAGKTRLARAFAGELGVEPSDVTSPTFTLIHEYEGRVPVFHFDAYRLAGDAEFEAIGADDYWEAGGICLVEWADRVRGVLPRGAWRVELSSPEPGGPKRRARLLIPGVAGRAEVRRRLAAGFDDRGGGT